MTSHITSMSLHIRLTALASTIMNHCWKSLIVKWLQYFQSCNLLEKPLHRRWENAHCLSYIQYYDNSIKRDTVVLTVDQNMDKKLKA